MMKRLLVAMVLATTSVPLMAQPCLACSCQAGPNTQNQREKEAKEADSVFTGKVWKIEGTYNTSYSSVRVSFFVEDAYKGTHRHRVTVSTANQGSACGFYFEEGDRYTVFGYGKGPKRFSTHSCSETRRGRIDPERYGL
ncbi:MAG TPA: hypothetical protein VEV82_10360 [Actinomycetota bacterium]|nr:hypothetical protein [Actinomycetota bacterium]